MTTFIAIAAISENRAIGKDGKIPWYIPEDWKHFKETTVGHTIVMWRKTYESVGRPLPGRENIILSRGWTNYEGTTSITDIEKLWEYLRNQWAKESFICWGSQIYREFFDRWLVDEVILSRIDMTVEWADAFFPDFESAFILERTDPREGFTIEYWKRKE